MTREDIAREIAEYLCGLPEPASEPEKIEIKILFAESTERHEICKGEEDG